MKVAHPYSSELLRVARKVVWYDAAERTLDDIPTFVAHLMVYGSPTDVKVVEKYMSREEFRKALRNALVPLVPKAERSLRFQQGQAPAGIFTQDAWIRWHEKLGIRPIPPLPRRRFPDGSLGPEAGRFLGR
jgi:hypothetical protein